MSKGKDVVLHKKIQYKKLKSKVVDNKYIFWFVVGSFIATTLILLLCY